MFSSILPLYCIQLLHAKKSIQMELFFSIFELDTVEWISLISETLFESLTLTNGEQFILHCMYYDLEKNVLPPRVSYLQWVEVGVSHEVLEGGISFQGVAAAPVQPVWGTYDSRGISLLSFVEQSPVCP